MIYTSPMDIVAIFLGACTVGFVIYITGQIIIYGLSFILNSL